MSEPVVGGPLCARAVAELAAIDRARAELRRQYEAALQGLAGKETLILAMHAGGAGCESDGPYGYDVTDGEPRWWVEAPVRIEAGPAAPREDEG